MLDETTGILGRRNLAHPVLARSSLAPMTIPCSPNPTASTSAPSPSWRPSQRFWILVRLVAAKSQSFLFARSFRCLMDSMILQACLGELFYSHFRCKPFFLCLQFFSFINFDNKVIDRFMLLLMSKKIKIKNKNYRWMVIAGSTLALRATLAPLYILELHKLKKIGELYKKCEFLCF